MLIQLTRYYIEDNHVVKILLNPDRIIFVEPVNSIKACSKIFIRHKIWEPSTKKYLHSEKWLTIETPEQIQELIIEQYKIIHNLSSLGYAETPEGN